MKKIFKILVNGFILAVLCGCMEENISPLTDLGATFGEASDLYSDKAKSKIIQSKVTGLVQIVWKGGKGMDNGNQPEEMLAFAGFEGFQGTNQKEVKGNFIYQVTTLDTTVHREIIAQLTGVYIDKTIDKTWLVGTVISDAKGCAGNGHGGHDSGCQGGSCGGHDPGGHDGGCSGGDGDDHTDGGCSNPDHGDTDHTDGGCSNPDHTDTDHTDGGCSGTDHTDGGCTDPDHSGGGCSGSDHTGGSPGDHGSGGDSGMGNPLKGKNCRVGQIIAVKCHDDGTPAIYGDGITWKWFSAEGSFVPSIFNTSDWPHLCKKTILEGNIMIHK
jgi:hypothetical protein